MIARRLIHTVKDEDLGCGREIADRDATKQPPLHRPVRLDRVHPTDPRACWCVKQYYAELDRRFASGFDPGASMLANHDELVPPGGVFLLATVGDDPAGCGVLKTIRPGVGSLKRLWVARHARGSRLGRTILAAIEEEARALGLKYLCLETNRALHEAIALYRSSGYREVEPFNDERYAHHWFEKELGDRDG